MIRIALIISSVGMCSILCGQSLEDKESIVQMSIDLAELQNYLQGKQKLIIKDDEIIPNELNLEKFNQAVVFMNSDDLFFNGIEDFIEFEKFEVSSSKAIVVYRYEGVTFRLNLDKTEDGWRILKKEMLEN